MRATRIHRVLGALTLLGVGLGGPGTAPGATPLESISLSPDVCVELGGATVSPGEVALDNLLGLVAPVALAGLPEAAAIAAYHRTSGGDALLSFGSALVLGAGLTARRGDVARHAGGAWSLAFDAAANGLGPGVAVDALSMIGETDLLLSFDVGVDLGAFTAGDEDLVRCRSPVAGVCEDFGSGPWFDGSLAGVADGLDLDAAHFVEGSGRLLLSFDASGVLGGVAFDDEDVLEHEPGSGAWQLAYDGSLQHPAWPAGDLVALHAATPAVAPPPRGRRCGLGFELVGALALLRPALRRRLRRRLCPRGEG